MKVIAFNGSPREESNTGVLIRTVFEVLEKHGIETEMLPLGRSNIRGCTACYSCFESKDGSCPEIQDDVLNEYFAKMVQADGIIIGSPTYFANVSTEVKALIDRAGLLAIANGHALKRKVGAAVISVRRAGAANVFDAINKFFLINQMLVPGSSYWNLGIGHKEVKVEDDQEGLRTMRVLGENMAWLLEKTAG
jgi:multimeric flavodoxin WrbA